MKLSTYTLAIGDYSDCLDKALESIRGVDEIIVQCGKDEKTIEIAKKYTDKVFTDYEWKEDGADARNHVLKKCTGDWILEIDCDNQLLGGIDQVKKVIETTTKEILSVKLSHPPHYHYLPILFKNNPLFRYVGIVHEVLNAPAQDNSGIVILEGRSVSHKYDPKRNIRRLVMALEKKPELIREKFYLGREYYDSGLYFNAVHWLNKYLKVGRWLPEIAEAYYYKALSLWKTSQGDKAREACLHAIEINANMRKALELMAEMSWPKNKEKWLEFAKLSTNEGVVFV